MGQVGHKGTTATRATPHFTRSSLHHCPQRIGKVHRIAPGMRLKKGVWPSDRTREGRLNTKLHAVCNGP